ncbi:MAG: RNA polymerase sigma factor [Actinomycetota bacterium]
MLAMHAMEPARRESEPLDLDADSFRRFYEDALPRVYGYLLQRCGGSAAVAEDLTQETFLAAVTELKKGRPVDAPVAWIYGIARHKLLDHYRRQERLERRRLREPAAEPAPPHEADDRALAALAAVPATQRIALVLRHVDGLSVPEVAAALGRSIEAVESLLARGRVGFKRAYGEASS